MEPVTVIIDITNTLVFMFLSLVAHVLYKLHCTLTEIHCKTNINRIV